MSPRVKPPTDPVAGDGRYRMIRTTGTGGMASVQLAWQINEGGIQRLAAVKRVRPDLATNEKFLQMFLEEARITTGLNHANIVQTYEVSRDADGCFLAMEYLRGQSYEDVLAKVGLDRVDYGFALEVLVGTLAGLEYAHEIHDLAGREMKLVHRDISPSNLFITYDGQVKILDFGIAKAVGSPIQTEPGVLKGKLMYMAPEQMRGSKVDARADLYAVGVMLWEVTAGRPRWEDPNAASVFTRFASGVAAEPPGAALRGLPALADEVCLRALSYDPEKRYSAVAEFRTALLELAAQTGRRTTRQLGEYVSSLFAAEREREQRTIELELERLAESDQASTTAAGGIEEAQPSKGLKTRLTPRRPPLTGGGESSTTSAAVSAETDVAPVGSVSRKNARSAVISIGLGFAIALLGGWWVLSTISSHSERASAHGAESSSPIVSVAVTQDHPAAPPPASVAASPAQSVDRTPDPPRATGAPTKTNGKRSAGAAKTPLAAPADGLSDRK